MSSDEEITRSPDLPKDSDHGSSVSSDFQDEYDQLLRYAVVTPKFGSHFLREHQTTAEQTTSDRFSGPRESVREQQAPERSQSSSTPDLPQHSEREIQLENPATTADLLGPRNQQDQIVFQRSPFHSGMEAFSPLHSEEMSLHGSSSSSTRSHVEQVRVTELPVSAENMQQVEDLLDLWSGNLKTNMMTELRKWKLTIIENHKLEMKQQSEKHAEHITHWSSQIDNLKGLLQTYETSIRRKDEVISNLTHALEKHKEKIELMRAFTHWRLQQIEARQEDYACSLADRHYRKVLLKNSWRTWHSVIEVNWKYKVEQACRARAEEVCIQLTNDYEAKVAQLNGAIEDAKSEVQRLLVERDHFEGTMKKAFMRGVCALNMEAMSMFQERETHMGHDLPSRRDDLGSNPSVTFQQPPASAPLISSQHDVLSPVHSPAGPSPSEQNFRPHFGLSSISHSKDDGSTPVVISATTSGSSILSSQKLPMTRIVTSAQQKAGRTITARVTGRSDLTQKMSKTGTSITSMGVSPPMSSIVVEKHHPITQQTIAQATAAKYPRSALQSSNSMSGRGTGHSTRVSHVHGSVHSIKVVE
ncbi:centrosomal protein POC5 isoform X2 [Rana temporaria]|uniref:centrosomal protein POC5 isoform X2 n=1 Tax=Rana temporaria TaxID=8407 RepID=UPI001AAD2769|nr:centrosomal protein POC5 isoform X2 [Rana temporaria]